MEVRHSHGLTQMIHAQSHTISIAFLIALVSCLSACAPSHPTEWEQHAYIWSRLDAVKPLSAPKEISALRVLVAQWSATGDAPWMLKSAAPETMPESAVAVVRLDGAAITVPAATVARSLKQTLSNWRAGWTPQAIEIDHESATARLGDYARWLREFRQAWGTQSPVWITALPDWRRSASLSELLDAVDVYTLQVHAIDANSDELIDRKNALAWIAQFEAHSATPYFIALPTYAMRVGKGEDGGVRFVESGSRVGAMAAHEQTLFADPTELASLATTLQTTRSRQRRGVAWFRLPAPDDRSTLSMSTFSALVAGGELKRKVEASLVPVQSSAMTFDVTLRNAGVHDTGLPRAILLGHGCEAGDTSGGYSAAPDRRLLNRTSQDLLHSGQARPVGWIRCASSAPSAPTVQW